MVKIRLMRIGARGRPFYRVVAVDERKKRTGGYLENLGTYNPLTTPHEIILKQDRIDEWIKKGAVPSVGFLRIIGKAPQRAPRKAKKEKKAAPTQEQAPTPAPKAKEETTSQESQETSTEQTQQPVTEAGVEATLEPQEAPVTQEEKPEEETSQPEITEPETPIEAPVEESAASAPEETTPTDKIIEE